MIDFKTELFVFKDTWDQYSLLDTGHGKRLEKFGKFTLIRNDPRAWWQPDLPEAAWKKADAYFEEKRDEKGVWHFKKPLPEAWALPFDGLSFEARFTDMSKHIGVFPEHAVHWRAVREMIKAKEKPLRILNLFGYTGAASLVAAYAGAQVTHVDASPKAIAWGRASQARSGLTDKPIRWLVDDALKFVKREGRRASFYDGILLDPPKYGRGPKGEIWKVEKDLPILLEACEAILAENASFLLLTIYATEDSAFTVGNLLYDLLKHRKGSLKVGELVIPHDASPKHLSVSLCGLWQGT